MQVIIVDDEPVARRTLRNCCANASDLEVVAEFGDSVAALERARRFHATQSAEQRAATLVTLLRQLEERAAALSAPPARLLGEANGRMHMLDAAAIELVEADRNYVTLRIGRDSYRARSTLAQAEAAMHLQPMLRVSRSCLVNTSHVTEISRTPRGDYIFVTRGGTTVMSSEGYREKARDYLERWRLRATDEG